MYCNSRLKFSDKKAMERGIGTIVSIILILLVIALVAWLLKKWVELELI